MKPMLTLLLSVTVTLAWFAPNVRVDHENRSSHGCYHADITVERTSGNVYVAIENDSFAGIVVVRSDIYFQKSTDAGQTWLAEDLLIRRGALFACYPDITTDESGNVYLVYTERPSGTDGHFYCVRSTDGGTTWSAPATIDDNPSAVKAGWARVAVDSAGHLFAAWNQPEGSYMRIFSSVSTNGGATWSARVRVDDDTVPADCFHTDVFVQPGTNHYLVTATAPYWVSQSYINSNSAFYRSTDAGATWSAGVVLDTFSGYCGQPHVVADEEHVICDFSGSSSGNQMKTEARTLYCGPDTWGPTVPVTDLGTLYSSYLNGSKMAIDPSGKVHVGLMVCDLEQWEYEVYYAHSTDHGATWAQRETVNDVTAETQADPNIAADSDGYAYLIWQDQRNHRDEIWFAANNPLGVAEDRSKLYAPRITLEATPSVFGRTTTIHLSVSSSAVQRSSLSVYDAAGQLVRTLGIRESTAGNRQFLTWDGSNDVGRRCAPGAYLIRAGSTAAKVILLPAN